MSEMLVHEPLNRKPEPAPARRRYGRAVPWQALAVWGALALLVGVAWLLSDHFLTTTNIFNILRQSSMIAIIAVGMTFVIISGGIDLSVGSVVLLAGVLLAGTLASGHGLAAAIAVALGVGGLAGLVNGIGVAFFRIPPFVMTLAGLTIYHGLAFIYSGGQPVRIPPEANAGLAPIAWSYICYTVPMPVVYVLVFYALGYIILAHTRLGIYTYAVGGNEEAARLSGVNVRLTKVMVYVISGLCAASAAVILTSRARTGEILAGAGYELDAIAAVVVGGTSLSGGRGGITGTLAGTLILFVLLNLFTMMNLHSYYQEVFKGAIIVIAVLMQYRRGRS